MMPAIRAAPSTSPFFASPARISSSVAGRIATRPSATATRSVAVLGADVDHARLARRADMGEGVHASAFPDESAQPPVERAARRVRESI